MAHHQKDGRANPLREELAIADEEQHPHPAEDPPYDGSYEYDQYLDEQMNAKAERRRTARDAQDYWDDFPLEHSDDFVMTTADVSS